jgi:hypothetical protein
MMTPRGFDLCMAFSALCCVGFIIGAAWGFGL